MKRLVTGLLLFCFAAVAYATVVPPVDTAVWAGRTAYMIVPTDLELAYEFRYQPGESTPDYGNWPRADGGMPVPPFPWPTIEGETQGLVYPVLKVQRGDEPAHDSNLQEIIWTQVICGPDAADIRQAPGCSGATDVVLDIPATQDLLKEDVMRNAKNRALDHRAQLTAADGWQFLEDLVQGALQGKVRNQQLPSWLVSLEADVYVIRKGFTNDIAACLRDLNDKIRCKYDAGQCGGTLAVQPGDFDVCWPAVPELPEL